MRLFLQAVALSFLVFATFNIYAATGEKDCVCLSWYKGFLSSLLFNEIEFVCITNADTEAEAGREAIHHPLFQIVRGRFPELLVLPLTVPLPDTSMRITNVLIDIETGVAVNRKTGIENSILSASQRGYSAWIRRCKCKVNKPDFKSSPNMLEINLLQ